MLYFEDFYEGEVFELGSHTFTEEEILEFARKYDPQPFHTDPEKAKDSLFGGLIASGWHTGSVFMRMYCDGILLNAASLGSPGMDEIRWPRPVRPGDTLTGRYTVVEAKTSKSRPNMGIIKMKCEMFNQNGEQVMLMTGTGFFGRKPTSEG